MIMSGEDKKNIQLTWSELIELRKKNDHTQKMIDYEDKVKSKEIAEKSGCPVPKNYYVGKSARNIPFDKLPKQYVVKPSHHASSRGIFLMNNGKNLFTGEKVSRAEIISIEQKYLSKRLWKGLGEWATYRIPACVIVEEFLPNLDGEYQVPTDYKCYVFHGRVCMVRVDYDRLTKKQSVDYYNRDFEIIDFNPIRVKYPRKNLVVEKPTYYDEMIGYVEKMGKQFGNFIRVDMYLTNRGPYFGEFTTYPGSGSRSMFTEETDKYMGALWQNSDLVLGEDQKPFTKKHFQKVLATLSVEKKTHNGVTTNGNSIIKEIINYDNSNNVSNNVSNNNVSNNNGNDNKISKDDNKSTKSLKSKVISIKIKHPKEKSKNVKSNCGKCRRPRNI